MRLSAGGCYQIASTKVNRVTDDRAAPVDLAGWRACQADLSAEVSTIAHADRPLTAEECALCNAIWRELDAVGTALAALERQAALSSAA